jgi:quercetin dioxygenase-like cupin family protein
MGIMGRGWSFLYRGLEAAALSVVLLSTGALAQEPGKAVVTPLLDTTVTASGQPITLPSGPVELTVSRFEIPPGASLPVHKHPYQRYAYVLAGSLRVTNAETGAVYDYKPGDMVVEVLDTWHSGMNTGTDTLVLLVIDQAPPGTGNTILQ